MWGVVCILLYFLFAIARFYEVKSGRRSYYALFLIPIVLFALAALKYLWIAPAIVGDPWGDFLRFTGGVIVLGTGFYLLKLMTGKRT